MSKLQILKDKIQDLIWKYEENESAKIVAINIDRTEEGIPDPIIIALINEEKEDGS